MRSAGQRGGLKVTLPAEIVVPIRALFEAKTLRGAEEFQLKFARNERVDIAVRSGVVGMARQQIASRYPETN
jgi:hypothetical protein